MSSDSENHISMRIPRMGRSCPRRFPWAAPRHVIPDDGFLIGCTAPSGFFPIFPQEHAMENGEK